MRLCRVDCCSTVRKAATLIWTASRYFACGSLSLHECVNAVLQHVQEADQDLSQAIEEHRTRQEEKELAECTFKPEVEELPRL